MTDNENELNNDNIPQNENINFIQDLQGPSPYVKEISNEHGERIIKITAWKSIYYALLLFLVMEIIEIILGFLLFKNNYMRWLFVFLLVPFIIVFLLIPANAICKFDYNNRTFSSYVTPVIPIPYPFFRVKIQFEDISFFYLFKIKKSYNKKKFYKIGLCHIDGEDKDIIMGQDHKCSRTYDPKLFLIPKILKSYLKP